MTDSKPDLPDNNKKYRISSKNDILSVLRVMIRNNSQSTCYFGDAGSFFPTALLDLDSQHGEMVLDYGPDEEINQQALQAEKWNVVAFPNQVKVQFSCQQIGKTEFEGRDAFLAQIPKSLLRMQKREYYRVTTPTIAPVECVIPLLEEKSPSTVEVLLQNLSCGGMAVIDSNGRGNFEEGSVYENCRITLPDIGTVNVSMRIIRVEPADTGLVHDLQSQRVNCEFVDAGENVLSLIQRYIIRLELERKRK
ncbi:c-di-GMP-binding flagellar brake protein YcgR, contains PilZNR and PilZ domains [Nitrosospira multiformis]|uniref:Flagellar brake protein YcgR n=1 Tax=Nitrosospira multiformis TaxID=1231 RepID=A0A1H8NJ58_9PROT|nr:flagellar brake protein [Nitrosospira multiformis]SEO29634.1 c-di-GMP-binding flagellar brake protein YcgR, contains PilZNR and PilZ domains [Nitrosospira multiformis]